MINHNYKSRAKSFNCERRVLNNLKNFKNVTYHVSLLKYRINGWNKQNKWFSKFKNCITNSRIMFVCCVHLSRKPTKIEWLIFQMKKVLLSYSTHMNIHLDFNKPKNSVNTQSNTTDLSNKATLLSLLPKTTSDWTDSAWNFDNFSNRWVWLQRIPLLWRIDSGWPPKWRCTWIHWSMSK